MHAAGQTASAVAVQADVGVPEHVVHGAQGAVPELDHVEPAMHAGASQNPVIARQAHVPLEQVTVCPDGQLEGGVLGHLEQKPT